MRVWENMDRSSNCSSSSRSISDRNGGLFGVETNPCSEDMALWFMSHAFKHYPNQDLGKLIQVIQDSKAVHRNFMSSPAIGFCAFRCIPMNRQDLILCLIKEGLDPNFFFRDRTMLHEAVRVSNATMLRFLLTLPGVKKDVPDSRGITPVIEAARGRPRCLKVLLEAGCNHHFCDKNGNTALHQAFKTQNAKKTDILACLDLLHERGADINCFGAKGRSLLNIAITLRVDWLLAWLILHNCDLNLPVVKRQKDSTRGTTGHSGVGHIPGPITPSQQADIHIHDSTDSDEAQDIEQYSRYWYNSDSNTDSQNSESEPWDVNRYVAPTFSSNPNSPTPFILACKLSNRKFVEVLISCGCDFRHYARVLESSSPVWMLYQTLSRAFRQADSLQLLCRKVIRRCLSTDIVTESGQLGLPRPLRCFLLCHRELLALRSLECDFCGWRDQFNT